MFQHSEDIKPYTVKSGSLLTPATRFPKLETPTVTRDILSLHKNRFT